MMAYHGDYHYKPVWDGTEECLAEIEDFRLDLDIPKWKTWLMPAGDTRETLIDMYPKSIELCMKMGYNWTGRDHIIAYDQKRAV
jgi:7-carboxy-7-deazaguanine synthase